MGCRTRVVGSVFPVVGLPLEGALAAALGLVKQLIRLPEHEPQVVA